MVFESILVDVLNRTLGSYVENLNSSQLKLGIWGGDVVLENLILKETALEELQIPIKAVYGRLGKLVLKIPWKNLYGASVEARIERLFLVLQPLTEIAYDAEKEKELEYASKQAELSRIEEAQKFSEASANSELNETFVEKLVTQIIKNVQVTITDIHIRYEDTTTNPPEPFSLGVTLHNISIHTTDENWVQTVVDETVTRVFKICDLDGLSFYWNSMSTLYSKLDTKDIGTALQNEIATKVSKPHDYNYILGPINGVAKLKLNPNPDRDDPQFSIPKVELALQMQELTIGLNKTQYKDIVLLADSMDRMTKAAPYRKYRPSLTVYRGHYKEWWNFAITCVLEEEVRRKRRNWDWNHMLQHRNLCKKYAQVYQHKITNKGKVSDIDKKILDKAEKDLDVLNLVIIRRRIELEVARQMKFEAKEEKKGGWFSSWWSGSGPKAQKYDDDSHLINQFEQAMTPEEKSKLYQAIDYQENSAPLHLPIEYEATKCYFHLDTLKVTINDEEQDIMIAKLENVDARMYQRPSANALKVEATMQSFTVYGSEQDKYLPRLVTSKREAEDVDLLTVVFETNPLSGGCDQRVRIMAQPLQIVYDAVTVIDLVNMFRPPHESSALATLQAAAGSKMTEFKEMSALGLQHAVQRHTFVDLDFDIDASYIIVPKMGKFVKETEPCIVVKLGAISVKSESRDPNLDVATLWRSGYSEQAILREISEHSYDKMTLYITDMQIVVATEEEDWLTPIKSNEATPLHLLQPTTLAIQFHKCVITDDPRLPKIKVYGELQKISVSVAEERLLTCCEILLSMPLPQSAEPEPLKLQASASKSASQSFLKYLDPAEKQRREEQRAKRKPHTTTVQLTEVEAFFIMKEFVLVVNRKTVNTSLPADTLMVFTLQLLEITMTQKTFVLDASLKLGSVNFQHHRKTHQIVNVIQTNKRAMTSAKDESADDASAKNASAKDASAKNASAKDSIVEDVMVAGASVKKEVPESRNEYLFVIKYVNVNKQSPDFRSVYECVEQLFVLHFTNLTVLLHMQSLQELLEFINRYQTRVAALQQDTDRIASAGTLTTIKEVEELSLDVKRESDAQATPQNFSKRRTVESIQLKMAMNVGAIEILFETDARPLSCVQLEGANFCLIMKSSYMQIDSTIASIKVDDLNPVTIHKEILKVLGGDVFRVNVVIYDTEVCPQAEVNMAIRGSISCLRIVYLNWFVNTMLEFLNKFQAAQSAILEASAQAGAAARAQAATVVHNAHKVSLHMKLDAPIILVPENSRSLNVVLVDLGKMALDNRFYDTHIPNEKNQATFDELTLKLEDLKMSCTELDAATLLPSERNLLDKEAHAGKEEHLVLKPTNFTLFVTRSLSPWCKLVPDLEVTGTFKTIAVILGKDDYKSIMRIMYQNLQEGQRHTSETSKPETVEKPVQVPSSVSQRKLHAQSKISRLSLTPHTDVARTTMKFAFALESFTIDLVTSYWNEQTSERVNAGLARFGLALMSVKGAMMSDESMHLSFVLSDIIMDDMRPGREDKISRYLERRLTSPILNQQSKQRLHSDKIPNMFDVTYNTRASDTFINIKISTFELILAMDFLNRVSEFVTKGLAENTPDEIMKDTFKYAETNINKQKQALEESTPAVMTLNISIEQPDIILVESMEQKESDALILHMEGRLKVRKTQETVAVDGAITDLYVEVRAVNCDVADDVDKAAVDVAAVLPKETSSQWISRIKATQAAASRTGSPPPRGDTLVVRSGRLAGRRELRDHAPRYLLEPASFTLTYSQPSPNAVHLDLAMSAITITVSPDVVALLSRVLATIAKETEGETAQERQAPRYDDLWSVQPYSPQHYWFLKTEEAEEATELEIVEKKQSNLRGDPPSEICVMTCPSVELAAEIEIGSDTIPVLIMQASFTGQVKDWSNNMQLESVWRMEMSYYNIGRATWEPFVEPVEREKAPCEFVYEPWEIKMEVFMQNNDSARPLDAPSQEEALQMMATRPPRTKVIVSTQETLEITLTSTSIDVLTQLSNSFFAALDEANRLEYKRVTSDTTQRYDDPYVLHNCLGFPIRLVLEDNPDFRVAAAEAFDTHTYAYNDVLLKPGASVGLQLKHGGLSVMRLNEAPPLLKLNITIDQTKQAISIPVERVGKRYWSLWPSTALEEDARPRNNAAHGFVSDVTMMDAAMQIYLQSFVQVTNTLSVRVHVYYMTPSGVDVELVGTVEPAATLRLPLYAVYTNSAEIFFAVENFTVSLKPFIWRELETADTKTTLVKLLECDSKDPKSSEKFYLQIVGTMERIYFEHSLRYKYSSCSYSVTLKPAVKLQNCLPVSIVLSQMGLTWDQTFEPGQMVHLSFLEPHKSNLLIKIENYMEKCWTCTKCLPEAGKELSVWTFESHDSPNIQTLYLGMHSMEDDGTQTLSLYCPFWMLNKTQMTICYRSTEDATGNVIFHPHDFSGPILFSFHQRNFFAKKRASIRVEFGEWSKDFSLDVPGSSGYVTCKNEGKIRSIAVTNQLSFNSLTKMVIFVPFYLVHNEAPFDIEYNENVFKPDEGEWILVGAQNTAALWPWQGNTMLVLRVAGTAEYTAPFSYAEHHTICLKLENHYGGLHVQIHLCEGGTQISVRQYMAGDAPALIINYTDVPVTLAERHNPRFRTIPAMHHMLFTWDDPCGVRMLAFHGEGEKSHVGNETDLIRDAIGDFQLSPTRKASWVSFLDGMQRVILITDDPNLASGAHTLGDAELVDTEIELKIHGIGLSLVNDQKHQEILYLSVGSSGVIWERCRIGGRRYKRVAIPLAEKIEKAFQIYNKLKTIKDPSANPIFQLDDKTQVNVDEMLIMKPNPRILRRTLEAGLWVSVGLTAHSKHLHARLHRLQVDQQLPLPVYPVVFAPVRPPRSVAEDATPKPFVEVSIIERLMKHSQVKQYRYYRVLVQEFHVKVDMGLVNALLNMFPQRTYTEQEALEAFGQDLHAASKPLKEMVVLTANEQKNFYDNLHLSPLKVHVSFSLGADNQPSALPTFIGTILQSIGVTLTNMNDVVLKLSYYERNYEFLSQNELYDQVTNHYRGQALKQIYVLVLGLDVIGNPYGLVVGLKKGVEDLFYEPFSGAIQGPGEFAEGLYLGVRSLVGHTVGGAADAVSRITGAMGHGLAALSLDKEYQKRRRDNLNKPSANFGEGLARSGKGLVMGVVDGVTGVFTKPIEGARDDGVGGFFRGVGIGAAGLFARPTSGVVDFATGSFDAVRRAADWSTETVKWRPPRFLPPDCSVRPYSRYQAEGFKILSEADKGKYLKTDVYHLHVWSVPQKVVSLCTNKRILYIEQNMVFGGWHVSWAYQWSELTDMPTMSSYYVFVRPPKSTSFNLMRGQVAPKKIYVEMDKQRKLLLDTCIEMIQASRG